MIDDRCETWTFAHDEEDYDVVGGAAVSPDGRRAYVTGVVFGGLLSTDWDMATVAVDTATGQRLWSARYDGPAGLRDTARAIGVSPNGDRVYVAGDRDQGGTGGTGDLAVVAYDASDGEALWATAYNGPNDLEERAHALAVGSGPHGDRVYVAGATANVPAASSDYLVAALDGPTGDLLWTAQYDGPGGLGDEAVAIGLDPAGERVFVTGFVQNEPDAFAPAKRNYATVAYDSGIDDTEEEQHGGEELWVALYDGAGGSRDEAFDLAVSPDGEHVFVTGGSSQEPDDGVRTWFDADYVTIAYDASDGTKEWMAQFDAGIDDIARSLAVSPDGSRLFVAGVSQQINYDFLTVAYDTVTGEEAWPAPSRVLAPNPVSIDEPYTVAVSPDGNRVYVTGQSAIQVTVTLPASYVHSDALTVSYDAASGDQRWVARHNSSELGVDSYFSRSGSWTSLVISPLDGSVFVARTFERHIDKFLGNPNPQDYGVVRYEP